MNYRLLGRTNIRVSEVAIGCSGYWGLKTFSEQQALNIIYEAFDRGVNFFDTGHNYSNFNAEPRLGLAIKHLLCNVDRTKLIISSKAGSVIGSAQIINNKKAKVQDFSPEAIESSCYSSIKNLNCDYLDIFQLHGASVDCIKDDLLQRLFDMKRRGMFRFLGINTHNKDNMIRVANNSNIFDMILIDYNLVQLDREREIDRLFGSGVGIVAGTVLAQGHLINKKIGSIKNGSFFWYLARSLFKKSSRQLSRSSKEIRNVLLGIKEMTPAQASFSYILSNKKISSCIFGTTNLNNCIEIIQSSGKDLSENNKAALRKAYEKTRSVISLD